LINASLNAVCSNVDVVKEEIMSLAHAAIEKAKGIAAERILFLESAKTELIRKKSEMKKIGRFLNHQKESVGPLAFLQAFNRYRALIKSMQEVNDLPPKLEIDGDLAVVGEIDVTSRSRKIESKKPARAERLVSPSFTLQFTTLTQIAEQKSRTKGKIGSEFRPFHESRIFLNPEEAVKLYFCFPFKSPPRTHLLFSSEQHGRSISQMHEMIDGIGITALLVRAGNFTFGGFAAAKWVSNGRPFGERSSSFLFSISRDAFIPYQPRVADACNLLATKNTIAFGKCDLRLAGDFNECSSMIENSYGIGFEQGSQEAKTFLAGAPNFVADIVEVWGFFNIES
jgi:hypothetical protein